MSAYTRVLLWAIGNTMLATSRPWIERISFTSSILPPSWIVLFISMATQTFFPFLSFISVNIPKASSLRLNINIGSEIIWGRFLKDLTSTLCLVRLDLLMIRGRMTIGKSGKNSFIAPCGLPNWKMTFAFVSPFIYSFNCSLNCLFAVSMFLFFTSSR